MIRKLRRDFCPQEGGVDTLSPETPIHVIKPDVGSETNTGRLQQVGEESRLAGDPETPEDTAASEPGFGLNSHIPEKELRKLAAQEPHGYRRKQPSEKPALFSHGERMHARQVSRGGAVSLATGKRHGTPRDMHLPKRRKHKIATAPNAGTDAEKRPLSISTAFLKAA